MVEDFPFFGLSQVRMSRLGVELTSPDLNLAVLLLNKLDKVFVLVHEMSVLGKQ
jgi:hypothetical protein